MPTPLRSSACLLCRLVRSRLVINGGEFEAVGVGAGGKFGDKKARQHAALQVLQQNNYAVSFDTPPAPAHGAPPGGAPQPRMQRHAGRHDAR